MGRLIPRLLIAVLLVLAPALPQSAFGQSSGGYSRPSSGFSSSAGATRRPSFGGGGGYILPSAPAGGGGYLGPSYGGDRAISRRSSASALQQYRTPAPPPSALGSTGGYDTRRPSAEGYAPQGYAPQGYAQRGYGSIWGDGRSRSPPIAQPSYGWAQSGRSFGVWDGLMLWGLLNSLSSPSSQRFFQDNQNNAGYQQWRAEADRSAQQDPQLRQRLAALDQQIAQGGPVAGSGKPPPLPGGGVPGPEHEDVSLVYIVLFLGVALFALLWMWRRRAAMTAAGPGAGAAAALRGSAQSRFRVGMTFPADPTPFVLAAGATKVHGPAGGGMISVEAIGVLMDGNIPLNRLYLPGRDSFFLLHLAADGRPDECRYFSRLDEVTPANREEWGVWLDPAQGMIGWPQFQTKDGKLYDRVWTPGARRVAPRDMTETVQDLAGTTTRKLALMLYGRSTGAAAPAPSTEYILVAAVDAGTEAFVEIHAGIDINPASLTLPSVPL